MCNSANTQYLDNFTAAGNQLKSLIGKAPTNTPDFSDPQIQAAKQSQILTALLQRGRQSSFNGAPGFGSSSVGDKQLLGE